MHARPRHSSGGSTPASDCGGTGLIPWQYVWNLWWTKGRWDRFISKHTGCFKPIIIPPTLHLSVISKRRVKLSLYNYEGIRSGGIAPPILSLYKIWGGQIHNPNALHPDERVTITYRPEALWTPQLIMWLRRKDIFLALSWNRTATRRTFGPSIVKGDGQCDQYRLQFQGNVSSIHPQQHTNTSLC